MNKIILSLLSLAGMMASSCYYPPPPLEKNLSSRDEMEEVSVISNDQNFSSNGKNQNTENQKKLYATQAISAAHFPDLTEPVISALQQQKKLLKYKKRKAPQKVGNMMVSNEQLQKTADILLKAKNGQITEIIHELDAHKIHGQDQRGNVHFTGYYTPVLPVSRVKSKDYPYPLYAFPQDWQGTLPSRKEIDGDQVLKGRNLELAYAKSLIDIYIMQVQGSGIVEYADGTQELFAFTGSNRKSYASIGKYMLKKGLTTPQHVSLQFIKKYLRANPEKAHEILFSNPSYVFFKPLDSKPKGAGLVPLTEMHSIAVDTRYIPMGSILLASVPVVNDKNEVTAHEYRLVLAQDIGGAINGPGHIDLYTGIGYEARKQAGRLHHYGNLWLLLPAKTNDPALALN